MKFMMHSLKKKIKSEFDSPQFVNPTANLQEIKGTFGDGFKKTVSKRYDKMGILIGYFKMFQNIMKL